MSNVIQFKRRKEADDDPSVLENIDASVAVFQSGDNDLTTDGPGVVDFYLGENSVGLSITSPCGLRVQAEIGAAEADRLMRWLSSWCTDWADL